MKQFFNLRLYLEGLKKIKVIGIAAAIVTVGLCALLPVIYILQHDFDETRVTDIAINQFAMPLPVIMLFAGFFVSSMFSYLNNRRDSDFYHSIPYRRECVYTSFMAAALTWVLAIITAAVVLTGALWLIAPDISFDISCIPLLILSTFCACLLIMAFMALAVSLTGTAASNIFIFGLLACFFRVACLIFTVAMEETAPIWQASDTALRFTDMGFFFPVALLGAMIEVYEPSNVYTNIPMYIYTFAVSAVLLLIAGYLYVRRRSETAGKSAPTKRLQHVYRIAFTTPFVLLMFMIISIDLWGNAGNDGTVYIVMLFVILLVYFLYELITTKNPKNMLRAVPQLPVLLAVGVLFLCGIGAVRESVLSKTPEPGEIESVVFETLGNDQYYGMLSYEDLQCRNVETKDGEVLKDISEALKYSVDSVRDGSYGRSRVYVGGNEYPKGYIRYTYVTVKINLSSGASIGRKLKMTEEDYTSVMTAAKNTQEYGNAYLKIPHPDDIYGAEYSFGIKNEELLKLYKSWYEEYNSLDREGKLKAKSPESGRLIYTVGLYGRENFKNYSFMMLISYNTPKTLEAYAKLLGDHMSETWTQYGDAEEISNKDAVIKILSEYYENDPDYNEQEYKYKYLGFSMSLYTQYGETWVMLEQYDNSSIQDHKKAAKLVVEALEDGRLSYEYKEGMCALTVSASKNEDYQAVDQSTGEPIYTSKNMNANIIVFCEPEFADGLEKYFDDKLAQTDPYYDDGYVKEIY